MACQVGMTTRPEERKKEWERERTVRNWRIVDTASTKTEAQRKEREIANRYINPCNYGAGGDGPEIAMWYIYYFEY